MALSFILVAVVAGFSLIYCLTLALLRNRPACAMCGMKATQEVGYGKDGSIYFECDNCHACYKKTGENIEVPPSDDWKRHYYTFVARPSSRKL
jgi:hypothetical protein